MILKMFAGSDSNRRIRFEVGHPVRGWQALDRWAVLGALLVVLMTSGGTDASRESVDATSTRDPAPQARMRRDRPSDRPVVERRAQHGGADLGARCGGGSAL